MFAWIPNRPRVAAVLAMAALLIAGRGANAGALLNVSFDISRELFNDVNAAFIPHWQQSAGAKLEIRQSHGGSSRQARAVIDGLDADVVTLNQAIDLDALAARGLVASEWRQRFPHGAAPFSSPILFLVRKGNPRNLRDWSDLVQPGVSVIVPNPKTSGNGRYSYLAAYAYARHQLKRDEAGARDFVQALFRNVPVLDSGGRGATSTFVQAGTGDVLLTFEAEIFLAIRELGAERFDVVRPSYTVDAEMPVAVVEKVARRKGNEAAAKAYLEFLYTPAAQEIVARHGFRPRLPEVLERQRDRFPELTLFRVEETLGPWAEVQKQHFASDGIFDQISRRLR